MFLAVKLMNMQLTCIEKTLWVYARIMKVMLTKVYLLQNQIEGVRIVNDYMRYLEFNELNKTGIEFDF